MNEAEYVVCIKKISAFNLNILIECKLNLCGSYQDRSLTVIFTISILLVWTLFIIMDVLEHNILVCRYLCTVGYTDHTVFSPFGKP
jgi:hypothetical protein